MKKVCFFDFIYNLGGAQKSTLDLLSNLKSHGINCVIMDAHGENDDFSSEVQNRDIEYLILKKTNDSRIGKNSKIRMILFGLKYLPTYVGIVIHLLKILKKRNFSFVWTNSLKGILALILVKKLYKFHLGFFIRGEGAISNKTSFQVRIINKYANKILVQSNSMRLKAVEKGFENDKTYIICNIVNPDILKVVENSSFNKENCLNVLLPATIIREKGIIEALEATSLLIKDGLNINLILAGAAINHSNTFNFLTAVKDTIKKLEIEPNTNIIGYRNDIISIMKAVDIVLLPSYSEGMPRVIMEAMLLGKAVIASDVGAISDLILHNETGVLIRSKNVNDIVEGILSLKDVEEREILGLNACNYIRSKYSSVEQHKQFLKVLK